MDPAQPKRVLGLPEPRVLDAVRRAWREDRKPANVLLVVDTSGSMAEANRLERAKAGLSSFFRNVGRQDSVGLTIFSDQITHLIPVSPYRANAPELREKVRNLIADGGTAVYDATIEGFAQGAERRVVGAHQRRRACSPTARTPTRARARTRWSRPCAPRATRTTR